MRSSEMKLEVIIPITYAIKATSKKQMAVAIRDLKRLFRNCGTLATLIETHYSVYRKAPPPSVVNERVKLAQAWVEAE